MAQIAASAPDPAIAASFARAFARRGQSVTVQRINGTAPRTSLVSAQVTAIVTGAAPDFRSAARTGYGSSLPGAITEADRTVTVLEADLVRARFPLPVQKDDRVVLASGDMLNVEDVDPNKAALAGAIVLTTSGAV